MDGELFPGAVASAIVGSIGDGCLIRLASQDGQRLTVVAVAHREPHVGDMLGERLDGQELPVPRARWAAGTLAREVPVALTGQAATQALTGTPAPVAPGLDGVAASTVLAPLRSEGRVVGVAQAFRGAGAPAYTVRERLLVAEIAAGVRGLPAPEEVAPVSEQSLLEHAAHAVWSCDLQGRITYANTACASLLGVPAAALTGTTMRRFLGCEWEGSPASLSAWPGPSEAPLTRADGQVRWVSVTCAPVTDPAGRRSGTVYSAQDITARRRREGSVRMALAAHRAAGELLDQAPHRSRKSLMSQATAMVADHLGAEFAGVFAVEGASHVIPHIAVGWDPHLVGRSVPFPARSATGLCLADDQPYRVADYEAVGDEVEMGELARRAEARSAVAIGIGSGLGVMGVVSPRPHAFADYDLSFLRTVSWLLASRWTAEQAPRLRAV